MGVGVGSNDLFNVLFDVVDGLSEYDLCNFFSFRLETERRAHCAVLSQPGKALNHLHDG